MRGSTAGIGVRRFSSRGSLAGPDNSPMVCLHARGSGREKEVAVFQMINESTAEPRDRKALLYKIGVFIVAMGAVGGVIFLCVRSLS